MTFKPTKINIPATNAFEATQSLLDAMVQIGQFAEVLLQNLTEVQQSIQEENTNVGTQRRFKTKRQSK